MRHRAREQPFNWSIQNLPNEPVVQWAAFNSDCKHEVHVVKSGVRITVVYSLIAIPTSPPHLKVRRTVPQLVPPEATSSPHT